MDKIYYWMGFIVFWLISSLSVGGIIAVSSIYIIEKIAHKFRVHQRIVMYILNRKAFYEWLKQNIG
jgi:hypothetical protein